MNKYTYPLVSVIVNCYNSEAYLKEALDSVYAQTYTNWEIIFWDNASTDSSADIAKSYDTKLRYFRGDETIMLGAARNLAISEANGELIAILDCDDIWLPQKLEKQVPHFYQLNIGLSYSNVLYFNNYGKSFYLYKKDMPGGKLFSDLLQSYFLCISSVIVRKSALDSLGELFDRRFGMIEEMDVFCRIAHDWDCAYASDVLARYRVHGSSDTWKKFEKIAFEYELLLHKFIAIYPDFEIDYPLESLCLKQMTLYYNVTSALLSGDSGLARNRLKGKCARSKKLWMLFLFTLLPATVFQYLYKKRKLLI